MSICPLAYLKNVRIWRKMFCTCYLYCLCMVHLWRHKLSVRVLVHTATLIITEQPVTYLSDIDSLAADGKRFVWVGSGVPLLQAGAKSSVSDCYVIVYCLKRALASVISLLCCTGNDRLTSTKKSRRQQRRNTKKHSSSSSSSSSSLHQNRNCEILVAGD